MIYSIDYLFSVWPRKES